MSPWIYRKSEEPTVRGICVLCLKNVQKKTSRGKFQALCSSCDRKRFDVRVKPRKRKRFKVYAKFKEKVCSECGFIPKHSCQLDIHHKDGNHRNNDPNNLETLCANCHRLRHKEAPLDIST
jgi:5-methylcytosine-specific restriction endonuclease McrA